MKPATATVIRLGLAQTLAWGSTYYLPAILAVPMARELGLSVDWIYAAFSAALVLSAVVGPVAGGWIDRLGGRPVLVGSNLVFALGLGLLAAAEGRVGLLLAWLVIGLGMGSGLYEAAFASLVRLYGQDSRGPITGITLIAGLASTVAWPLSTLLENQFGWREACAAWAVLHLLLGLPLNAALPRAAQTLAPAPAPAPSEGAADTARDAASTPPTPPAHQALAPALLAFVFAATWFTSTAMAAHLPRLLHSVGVEATTALVVGSLIGPAQVLARVLEFGWLQRVHPLLSARLAALQHPLGVLALALGGPAWAPVFAVLHGAGNGILTIAKGTLPLVLFGPQGYGLRQGWLMVPARLAQALAPFVFGLVLDRLQAGALALTAGLGVATLLALLALRTAR